MSKTVIYPGTFDPITVGHLDIIEKASKTFDKVIVAIGHNPEKNNTMFSFDLRMKMIKESVKDFGNVEVDSFSGLLVNYCQEKGVSTIVRGIRAVSDLEYELSVGYANESLDRSINTVFFMPHIQNSFVSSSVFRAIFKENGEVSHLVSKSVYDIIFDGE